MENNTEITNFNGAKILNEFEEIEYHLERYIDSVAGTEKDVKLLDDPLNRPISGILHSFLVKKIPEYKLIVESNIELFKNHDFAEILWNELSSLRTIIIYNSTDKLLNVFENIKNFISKFENIKLSIISLQNANNLIKLQLQPAIDEVKEKVKDFESVRLALEQRETSSIYLDVHNKYKSEFIINNALFFLSLFSGALLTLYSTNLSSAYLQSYSNYSKVTTVDQWFILITIKLLIITLTITLCTLFLRRSAHAKKLYEQAYQTHVEINAFPIHVRSLKDEDKQELIKELALKYFGKELDQTQNDKIGDLMSDQVSAGTELIRASAEMLKAKNDSKATSTE